MRWFLLSSAMLAFSVQAAPQFSLAQCQQLNAERLQIQKKLRQPYDEAQGRKMQQRLEELSRILHRHCQKPVKDGAVPAPYPTRA